MAAFVELERNVVSFLQDTSLSLLLRKTWSQAGLSGELEDLEGWRSPGSLLWPG